MILSDNGNNVREYNLHSDINALLALDKASGIASTSDVWQPIREAKRAVFQHMIRMFVEGGIEEKMAKEIVDEFEYVIDQIVWES